MPQLQLHMLRVAGVAKTISDNFQEKLDKKAVISVCLLHDLGNMAKIKLDLFPEFAQPLGIKYWENVLSEFKKRYGEDDYRATYTILKELGVARDIYELVQLLEFAKAPQTASGNDLELKICLYSDARVTPHQVVFLKDRLVEVKERYIRNKGVGEEKYDQISKSLFSIEKQIFDRCKINPEDITEEKVEPLIKSLRYFNIVTK